MSKQIYYLNATQGKKKVPVVEYIPNIDEIITVDSTGKTVSTLIRYVPGERTIYVDKQSERAASKAAKIRFGEGYLAINQYDTLLKEYLDNSNYCGNNPNRRTDRPVLYWRNEPEKAAQKKLNDDFVETEIKYKIHTMKHDDLEKYAFLLGVRDIDKQTTAELKRDVMVLSLRDPKKFYEASSEKSNKKFLINKAAQNNVIKIQYNQMSWVNGGNFYTAPMGVDAVDHFIESTASNAALTEVMIEIERIVNPSNVPQTKTSSEDAVKSMRQVAEDLFDRATALGVITTKGTALMATNNEGESFMVGRGRENTIHKIETDYETYNLIKTKVEEAKVK